MKQKKGLFNTTKFSTSYTLYGLFFGLFFPIIAISLDLYLKDLQFTFQNIIHIQMLSPAHWLVDMVPMIFAISYYFIGKRSDELLSEKKKLIAKSNELEEAYHKLQKLDQHKDDFLSNISHELRTPLTSIKSYIQMMDKGILGKINKDQKEGLDIVLNSTNHLIVLINDLLDVSRYEAVKARLHFEESDIKQLIDEVAKEFRPIIEQVGGGIKTTIPENLKSVVLDPEKIKQVIRNLINNSIKYRSEKKLKVEIDLSIDDHNLSIRLKDNGMGISKENKDHLFDKFYQVDQSMTRKVEGSGLGLSIVLQIIKTHKGNIKVDSQRGEGTVFDISLPTDLKPSSKL